MRSRCKSLLLGVVFFAGCSLAPLPKVEILVLAAASVAQVVEDQSEIFSREEGVSVIVSSGSSGFLARQIQLGVGAVQAHRGQATGRLTGLSAVTGLPGVER